MPETSGAPWAVGNQATCEATGFFQQFGLMGTYLSNSSLSLLSYLMVNRNWTDARLQRLEWKVHVGIFLVALVVAAVCIPLQLYNPAFSTCHIEAAPPGCEQSWKDENGSTTCERGDNAFIYSLAFNVVPLWTCVLCSIWGMVQIYRFVRSTEQHSSKYERQDAEVGFSGSLSQIPEIQQRRDKDSDGDDNGGEEKADEGLEDGDGKGSSSKSSPVPSKNSSGNQDSKATVRDIIRQGSSNLASVLTGHGRLPATEKATSGRASKVASQAIWYSSAFIITYLPVTVAAISWLGFSFYSQTLVYVVYTFLPLQGFFNFLVFARQRRNMNSKLGRWMRFGLFGCSGTSCRSVKAARVGSSSPSVEDGNNQENERNIIIPASSNERSHISEISHSEHLEYDDIEIPLKDDDTEDGFPPRDRSLRIPRRKKRNWRTTTTRSDEIPSTRMQMIFQLMHDSLGPRSSSSSSSSNPTGTQANNEDQQTNQEQNVEEADHEHLEESHPSNESSSAESPIADMTDSTDDHDLDDPKEPRPRNESSSVESPINDTMDWIDDPDHGHDQHDYIPAVDLSEWEDRMIDSRVQTILQMIRNRNSSLSVPSDRTDQQMDDQSGITSRVAANSNVSDPESHQTNIFSSIESLTHESRLVVNDMDMTLNDDDRAPVERVSERYQDSLIQEPGRIRGDHDQTQTVETPPDSDVEKIARDNESPTIEQNSK